MTDEKLVPVLKNRTGQIIKTQDPPAIYILRHCRTFQGHKVIWGPRCRVMKRVPKGREMVSLECKTCGNYIEWIPASV